VDVINHAKFVNEQSQEYKVTEDQILPCIVITCHL